MPFFTGLRSSILGGIFCLVVLQALQIEAFNGACENGIQPNPTTGACPNTAQGMATVPCCRNTEFSICCPAKKGCSKNNGFSVCASPPKGCVYKKFGAAFDCPDPIKPAGEAGVTYTPTIECCQKTLRLYCCGESEGCPTAPVNTADCDS